MYSGQLPFFVLCGTAQETLPLTSLTNTEVIDVMRVGQLHVYLNLPARPLSAADMSIYPLITLSMYPTKLGGDGAGKVGTALAAGRRHVNRYSA